MGKEERKIKEIGGGSQRGGRARQAQLTMKVETLFFETIPKQLFASPPGAKRKGRGRTSYYCPTARQAHYTPALN